jgi:uncharacterized protein YndB with AHSA1/START domain
VAVRTRAGSSKPLAAERGCLVIADISGYTGYVVESPLEHAEDVLADVTGLVAERLGRVLVLNKREGDAVFGYVPEGALDGTMLLDAVEDCYFAFRNRLVGMQHATSCDCNACGKLPELDLKFVVHFGDFIRRPAADGEELTGSAVIVAHRLLKNAVEAKGYALLTESAVTELGIDPDGLGLAEHREDYPDVGEIGGWTLDLEARWHSELDRRRILVGAREAEFEFETVVPVPPSVAWEHLTTPAKRTLWQGRVEQETTGGRRGPGTTSFCVDGRFRIFEEILDWRPFSYFTEARTFPGGKLVVTTELLAEGAGTRVRVRGKPERSASLTSRLTAPLRKRSLRQAYDRFADLLAQEA